MKYLMILLVLAATTAAAEQKADLYEPLRKACTGYGFKPETEAFAVCVQREHLARLARLEAEIAREQQREDVSDQLLLQILMTPCASCSPKPPPH